jgi:hypothetical protein
MRGHFATRIVAKSYCFATKIGADKRSYSRRVVGKGINAAVRVFWKKFPRTCRIRLIGESAGGMHRLQIPQFTFAGGSAHSSQPQP